MEDRMADRFRFTHFLRCSAAEAERLFLEAGDEVFCDCETHVGGFANPDHMTRVPEPCRHEFSTMAPVREEEIVFLELTEAEARALAAVLPSPSAPAVKAVAEQLERELADLDDMNERLRA
jgi:hypothetical protein